MARCLSVVEESLPERYVVEAGFFKPVLLPAQCSLAVADTTVWLSSRDQLNVVVVVDETCGRRWRRVGLVHSGERLCTPVRGWLPFGD